MTDNAITLRYFDARGRAQFLRYYFRHREIAFAEDRVPMSAGFPEWLAIRDDGKLTGPFRKLPVLHWGAHQVAEALVIRSFIHRKSGDSESLSEEENLRDEMLASSIYHELMRPTRTLLWAELIYPGLDLPAFARKTRDGLRSHLVVLDEALREWSRFERLNNRPLLVTDCLLWEELDALARVFGDHLTLDGMTALERFYEECPGRATFELVLRERPCQLSGSPTEPAAISRLQEILRHPVSD